MNTNLNLMEASDEEVLRVMDPTSTAPAAPAVPQEAPEPEKQADPPATGETSPPPAPVVPVAAPLADPAAAGTTEAKEAPQAPPVAPAPATTPDTATPAEEPLGSAPDYKAFYEQVMGPIKSGKKTIQLSSAEEVISLLHKGLDYTQKTMDLGKYRKYNMMLENAGLLDERALELLIGVHKKDPEAIKRFFKDSKVDPVDIDVTSEDKYKPGAHAVSDQEAKLQEAIDDLKGLDGGMETLEAANKWDEQSKQTLWGLPGLLRLIHDQRTSGVYAKVTAEVERRQALGKIPAGMPFINAYKMVGDELLAQGSLGQVTTAAPKAPAPAGSTAPVPVARRPASPPAGTSAGNPSVRAAAATRTGPKPTQSTLNFAEMSDEEFSKVKL